VQPQNVSKATSLPGSCRTGSRDDDGARKAGVVAWGYGTPGLADLDRDGDLDYVFGVRGDSVYWFEFEGADTWIRHTLGPLPKRSLGATTLDVDGDGWSPEASGTATPASPARILSSSTATTGRSTPRSTTWSQPTSTGMAVRTS